MKRLFSLLPAIALAQCAAPATAQTAAPFYIDRNGTAQAAAGVFAVDVAGGPSVSKQEAFGLAAANVAVATPPTVYGGQYIFAQTCTTYGTVALQVLGPDGATYQTILSLTKSDATAGIGGTEVLLGTRARVRVLLSGTAGCAATLSRVPA